MDGVHTGSQQQGRYRFGKVTRARLVLHVRVMCDFDTGKAFIQTNPHNSFAPYRSPVSATWFVDGADYMSAVADALENAKEEIFIADWWLSPEIHMKRPQLNGDYWRLDKILQRKAVSTPVIFHRNMLQI